MANVIDILINAKDQASATIKKVGDTLNKNQESFKKMAVAGGIAFGALSWVIMKSVASAQESQMVHTQLEAVLKSTGNAVGLTVEAIEAHSSALQKNLGISDEVIASGQNMLLTFTNIGKDVFPKATETMLDMATAMNGGAIPSAEQLKGTSIQLWKALNDPIKGISALSKVGVTFTEDQKKMIAGMVEMGDTAGAQKLILAELNREFGGSALAQSKTFEGSMRKLSVTFGDIFENVGMALIPAFQKMADTITPIVQKVTEWAGANPQLVTTIIAISAVLSGLLLAVGTFGAILPSIAGGISALAGVFWILLGPIWLVIGGIALLGVAWKTNFLGIQEITASVWQSIVGTFEAGVAWIMKTIEPFLIELRQFWSENGKQIIEGLTMFWEGAKIVFTQMFEWIKFFVGASWDIISGIFSVAFTIIKANFEVFFTVMTAILTTGMQILNGDWGEAWETVKNTFSRVGEIIVRTWGEVFEKLSETVTSIVDRIENYVSGSLLRIKDTLKEIVSLGRANTTTFNGATAVEIAWARAKGWPVMNGDAYLVGEDWPEIFTPSRSGTIIPNDKVGGGANVQFNFGGITINNKNDADYFLDGLARKMQLGKIGIL